jgi:hypothetical protein
MLHDEKRHNTKPKFRSHVRAHEEIIHVKADNAVALLSTLVKTHTELDPSDQKCIIGLVEKRGLNLRLETLLVTLIPAMQPSDVDALLKALASKLRRVDYQPKLLPELAKVGTPAQANTFMTSALGSITSATDPGLDLSNIILRINSTDARKLLPVTQERWKSTSVRFGSVGFIEFPFGAVARRLAEKLDSIDARAVLTDAKSALASSEELVAINFWSSVVQGMLGQLSGSEALEVTRVLRSALGASHKANAYTVSGICTALGQAAAKLVGDANTIALELGNSLLGTDDPSIFRALFACIIPMATSSNLTDRGMLVHVLTHPWTYVDENMWPALMGTDRIQDNKFNVWDSLSVWAHKYKLNLAQEHL